MNKKLFFLIIILMTMFTLFSAKLYINAKTQALNENSYFVELKNKIKKVYALKNKYKFNVFLFNHLKKYCNINQNGDKYVVICKNLNMKNFNIVQDILFKNNFKINSFEIKKNKFANIRVEINK